MVWQLFNVTRNVDLTLAARPVSSMGWTHQAYAETSRFACVIDDEDGTITIENEDELRWTDDAGKAFAGFVRTVVKTDVGVSGHRIYNLTAQDYTTLLSDDVVDAVGSAILPAGQSDKQWIASIFAAFGKRGVVIGALVQQLRASMPADLDTFGMTLHEVLTAIAKVTGGSFYVDFDKRLHYFKSETESAPFALSDTPNGTTTFGYERFELPSDSVEWCNAVFVVGEGVSIWRYLGGVAPPAGKRRAHVIRDPSIVNVTQAAAVGDSYLESHGDYRAPGSLVTYRAGLRGGMLVQVTHSGWGIIARTFRISAIEAKPETPTRTAYRVRFGGTPVNLGELFRGTAGDIRALQRTVQDVDAVIADLSVGGGNMVPNSSFEDGSAWSVGPGWVIGFAPPAPDAAFAGTDVARLVVSNAQGALATAKLPVARSDHWWASAWQYLRSYGNGAFRMYVEEWGGTNGDTLLRTTTVATTNTPDTEWRRMAVHFAPSPDVGAIEWHVSTTHVVIGFDTNGATATGTWDVDGVQLERGRLLSAYAPAPYELLEGSVGPTVIADDAVTTPKLIANAVAAGKVAADTIGSREIQALAVTTNKLDAGAVSADKMLIGGARNALIDNPGFEAGALGTPHGWTLHPTTGGVVATVEPGYTGARALRLSNPSGMVGLGSAVDSSLFPSEPHERVQVTFVARSASGTPSIEVRLVGRDANKANPTVTAPGLARTITSTWTRYTCWLTVPAGAVFSGVVIRNATSFSTIYVDDVLPTRPMDLINPSGGVVINRDGIGITDGKLRVTNPAGTVIIDGSSDMFRIIAAGTMSVASQAGGGTAAMTSVDIATGLTYRPSTLIYWLEASGSVPEAILTPYVGVTLGGTISFTVRGTTQIVNTNQTRVACTVQRPAAGSFAAQTFRYYVLQQEAI